MKPNNYKIPFNKPPYLGNELDYIAKAIAADKICGDGTFTHLCHEWFEKNTPTPKALLTTSCTHAMEIAALLMDIQPGDEVILPSFTFVSTADAFVLRGATAVFADIRLDTMNIDETLIEDAITEKTRCIAVVHYAGVSCDMDVILALAQKYSKKYGHKIFVLEDAAQGMMAAYKGKALGTMGDFGAYSFHETKNYSCGEGGLLLIKDASYALTAEIIREKGTDRSRFYRGEVDKYTWQSAGSSYLPSELNAAYLYAQLEAADIINNHRNLIWNQYYEGLLDLANKNVIALPTVPKDCVHNAHMFYIKTADVTQRSLLIEHLKADGILATSHYVPLHSSPAGQKLGRFHGTDNYTTKESLRILRLPLYYSMTSKDAAMVIQSVNTFYKAK